MSSQRRHPASAIALLRRHGLRPRKGLGQHFLVNRGALLRIVEAADLQPQDTVIEVGPGTGVLTRELAARARRVIAIEKDRQLAAALQEEMRELPGVHIVVGDVLDLDPSDLMEEHDGGAPYKVVANLPYYVANPVLRKFLEAPARPALMVVLLQKEVAESIVARPGAMSILSVAVQIHARPRVVGTVKAGSFYPAPKVDSAIVRLDVRPTPMLVPEGEVSQFMYVVRAGFSAPRKQLANALAQALDLPRQRVSAILSAAGVAPQRRAETLSLQEWAALHRTLREAS